MNHGKKNSQDKDLQDEYDFEDDENLEADPMQLELEIDDEENNANFQLDIDANAPEIEDESWETLPRRSPNRHDLSSKGIINSICNKC